MADRLSALRARLRTAGEGTRGAVRRHAFWITLPAVALGVAAVAGAVGASAVTRADEWRVRSQELHGTLEAAARWRRELVPPTSAEEAAWRESEAAVRERGIEPADRLALLQEVAQRAEELGIGDIDLSFASSDELETTALREVGEAVYEVAPWALAVRFTADYPTIASFIGSLPPQVDVHRLAMTAVESGVATELVLIVFAAEGS